MKNEEIETLEDVLYALLHWQKICLDCGRSSSELGMATKPIEKLKMLIQEKINRMTPER